MFGEAVMDLPTACGYEVSESSPQPIHPLDIHILPPMAFTTAQAAKIDAACGEFVRLTAERLVEVCQELIELRKREVR
jgi:hypothetical protein